MQKFDRTAFVLFLLVTLLFAVGGLVAFVKDSMNPAKWFASAGLLATVTGVIQLEVSGFFDKIIEHFSDERKYPYGPPSYITREIIDNPDEAFRMWLRGICYFNIRTGFWLIIVGTLLQVVAIWL